MHRHELTIGLTALLVLGGALPCRAGEKESAAQITKLGGKLERDEKGVGKPVTKIDLASCKELKDDDLKALQAFPQLEWLSLNDTPITDAGLAHVRGLNKLKTLGLAGTRITDKGLGCLKGLTNLDGLNLNGTKVTKAGVAKLRQSLPNAIILSSP